jgi:hypothetical protein
MTRLLSTLICLLSVTGWAPNTARAISLPPPPEIKAPRAEPDGALALLDEIVEVHCVTEGNLHLRCRADARYTYRVVGDSPQLRLPEAARITIDARLVRGGEDVVAIAAQPGETVQMRVHHRFDAVSSFTTALPARHPILGESPRIGALPIFLVVPSDPETLAESAPARVTVRASNWTILMATSTDPPQPPADDVATTSLRPGVGVRHLSVRFDPGDRPIYQGGPVLAVGGDLDDGFRMRAGWEVGVHALVLASLSAETNFRDEVVATPLLEGALPAFGPLPSLAAGLGAPVRLAPDVNAGLRIQLTASYFASFVTSFDWFPAADDRWRLALYGQIGL